MMEFLGAVALTETRWEEPCYPGLLYIPRDAHAHTARRLAGHSWLAPKPKATAPLLPAPEVCKKPLPAESSEEDHTEPTATSISILRLVKLLDGEVDGDKEDDDYGAVIPSMFAFATALQIVFGAIKVLGEDMASSPVVDSQGGIRITWRRGDRQVKLVCPATKDAPLYIYQSSAAGNAVQNQNVTAESLAARLSLLIGRERVPQPARD